MTLVYILLLAYTPFFYWMYKQAREDWKATKMINREGNKNA